MPMYCSKCGYHNPDEAHFCSVCGTYIDTNTEQKQHKRKQDIARRDPRKYLVAGGVVVVILLLGILCAFLMTDINRAENYALYLKEGQVWLNKLSTNAAFEITTNLKGEEEAQALADSAESIAHSIHVSEDGSAIFYLDKRDGNTGTLYCRNAANPLKEPIKVAADVARYSVSQDSRTITYLKRDTLYQNDLNDEDKIAKNVGEYYVSDDGKTLLYCVLDDDVYTWYYYFGGEVEIIGTDITIRHRSEDLKTVWYLDGETLHRKELGKDATKLISGVTKIYGFLENETFYYLKGTVNPLTDYFSLVSEGDGNDDLRALLRRAFDGIMAQPHGSLYYFNGEESVKLAESCCNIRTSKYGDAFAICYSRCADKIDPFTVQELSDACELSTSGDVVAIAREMVEEALSAGNDTYIAVNGTANKIDIGNIERILIKNDGAMICALCDVDQGSGEGDIYQASVYGGEIGTFEKLDDSVDADAGMYFLGYEGKYSDYFCYFRNVENQVGELCIDGESIDENVYIYYLRYNDKGNSLTYLAEYDAKNRTGALMVYDGDAIEKISDDVYKYYITTNQNGDIVYLYDYNDNAGTLAVYDGRQSEDIAEDVYQYTVTPRNDILYLCDYSTTRHVCDLVWYNGKKREQIDQDVAALVIVMEQESYSFE